MPEPRHSRHRRGTQAVEFILISIPTIFIMLSVFESAMVMWEYHTLASAAQMEARYIVVHGSTCTTCNALTIGTLATYLEAHATGLDPSKLGATFISTNSSTGCTPISGCTSSSTAFPPSTNGDNAAGLDITVKVTYPVNNPIVVFWPGTSFSQTGSMTLGAVSTQRILY